MPEMRVNSGVAEDYKKKRRYQNHSFSQSHLKSIDAIIINCFDLYRQLSIISFVHQAPLEF